MSTPLIFAVSGLLAWLLGSIPFSLLIARWFGGFDLRERGSGNVGATNVTRTMGARWGAVALILDACKGVIPTLCFPMWLTLPDTLHKHQQVLCGVCAIVGHMYPVWLAFRGGKGVATALGVVSILAPLSTLIAFLVFALTFAVKRIVSLSSLCAAFAFPIAQILNPHVELWTRAEWSLAAFTFAVPLLIVLRHRSNIGRLWRGEESPLSFKRTTAPDSAPLP